MLLPHCCVATSRNFLSHLRTYLRSQEGRNNRPICIMRQAMNPTNEKPFPNEFAIYHAARIARAEAFARLVRKAAGGIASLVKRNLVGPLRARAERRRQLDELLNMDDHMLRDLGLSRGGIAYAFEHGRDAEPANTNVPLSKPRAA